MKMRKVLLLTAFSLATLAGHGNVFAQGSVPVPRPFPGAPAPAGGSPAPRNTPPPPPPAVPDAAPVREVVAPQPAPPVATPEVPGVPIYPAAEYLDTIDAGSGQRYYLYGTNATYADIVTYYRNVLKNGGREIYRTPGTYQFDLGRFNENRMAYPPSVVVKDYAGDAGYLFVSGTAEKRFPTIIQIVPPDGQ